MAILGDMLELGVYSMEAHRDILFKAKRLGIKVVTVGAEFQKVATAPILNFSDTTSLKNWFEEQRFEDTMFLLKGSRGIGLERLLG